MRVVGADGRTLIAYCNPDRLEAHLKELSPADAELAEDLADGVRQFMQFRHVRAAGQAAQPDDGQRRPGHGPADAALRAAPGEVGRALGGRFRRSASRIPFLRRALPQIFGWPEIPMMAALSLLAYMETGTPASRPAVPGVCARHRTPLSGAGRRDPLQSPGAEDPGGKRPGGGRAPL